MNSYANQLQENKNQKTAAVTQKRSNNSISNYPANVAQMQLQEIANNSKQVKEATQLQAIANANSGNEVIQRVIAPSFAAKNRRANGTAIPLKQSGGWKRPDWLRGEDDAVDTMINNLITAGKAKLSPDNSSHIFDFFTGTWISVTGVSIDHIMDWENFARSKGVTDYQGLEDTYHEMDNLIVVPSRVNSSKQQTDPLHWMGGKSHESFMKKTGNEKGQQRLDGFYDELIGFNPDMDISSIPEAKRGMLLNHLGTIQNPRQGATMKEPMNAFSLMMAYQGARDIVGIKDHHPINDNQDDEKMEESE